MKKKKPDMLTILLYAIIVFAVLYVSAGLGAAMDLSVDDEGVLDFNVLMTQFETVLTSTDTVGTHFTDFSSYSFKITLMVAFALGIYALMKYTSRKRLHRKGVEHGSARWANEKEEKFLADRMSAGSKPKRGKDAAQQSLRTATKPEKKKGKKSPKSPFETDNINLIDMSHSNNYNPFNYIYDKDGNINKTYVMKMVNCLMKNTKQEGASGGDQFWDDSTKALTLAIAFYLLEKKTDEKSNSLDRNFSTVMKIMRLAEISEQDENHRSPLDDMMDELRAENPHSMAVSFYADFKKAPAETAKSILISAAVRFAAFNLPEVADLTHTDNIHLDTLGDRKTALFIIIPSSDATFNFLAAMMYTQLFDTLYDTANFKYGGRLPVHVRCLLDEFANVGTIPDFDKLLATMRSMEISANIIIQNLAQLKKMYDKSWEILTGNCDSLLFLGGQEASTLEAISKSLGKETIDVVSQNRTRSHKSPSTSENNSILGRELMTTDELKVMKPNECVLIVRALYPFFCHKFDIEKHQNYKYLEDSNKNYAYLIDDLHTEKAPDMTEIYSETVEPKLVAQSVDDEKDISDIDVPDEEDNMTNLDEEFDTKEIAAALKQHEEQTAGEEMFNENEELDFSDEAVPENLMPMDLSTPKVIGEADFREIVDSPF